MQLYVHNENLTKKTFVKTHFIPPYTILTILITA